MDVYMYKKNSENILYCKRIANLPSKVSFNL